MARNPESSRTRRKNIRLLGSKNLRTSPQRLKHPGLGHAITMYEVSVTCMILVPCRHRSLIDINDLITFEVVVGFRKAASRFERLLTPSYRCNLRFCIILSCGKMAMLSIVKMATRGQLYHPLSGQRERDGAPEGRCMVWELRGDFTRALHPRGLLDL